METTPGDEKARQEELEATSGSEPPEDDDEEVDKQSEDSFPASDPPSY